MAESYRRASRRNIVPRFFLACALCAAVLLLAGCGDSWRDGEKIQEGLQQRAETYLKILLAKSGITERVDVRVWYGPSLWFTSLEAIIVREDVSCEWFLVEIYVECSPKRTASVADEFFPALIAHELGHVAGGHLCQSSRVKSIGREQEQAEADAFAIQLVGEEAVAATLSHMAADAAKRLRNAKAILCRP